MFACKSTGGVLAAPGLDFRLGVLRIRGCGAAPAYACLALRASWLLVPSLMDGLGRASAHSLAPDHSPPCEALRAAMGGSLSHRLVRQELASDPPNDQSAASRPGVHSRDLRQALPR